MQGRLFPTTIPALTPIMEFVPNALVREFPPPLPIENPMRRHLIPADDESFDEDEFEHGLERLPVEQDQDLRSSKRQRTEEAALREGGTFAHPRSPAHLRHLHSEGLHLQPPHPLRVQAHGCLVHPPGAEHPGERAWTFVEEMLPPGPMPRPLRPLRTQTRIPAPQSMAAPENQRSDKSGTVLAKAFETHRMRAQIDNESIHLAELGQLDSFHRMVGYVAHLKSIASQSLATTLLKFAWTGVTDVGSRDVPAAHLATVLFLFTYRGCPMGFTKRLAQLLPREWPADIAALRADCVERWRRISPCTPQRKIVQGIVLSRYGEPDRT
ncbi:hypothetical protein J2739_000732 [Variovorax soli]|uniref:Uncharacterized protein n=2 Tax=Variovorax soli TaxID=376815 RepID=A0ABU1N963_9BURK|nr:hypothetical protein [Variovorax soli]